MCGFEAERWPALERHLNVCREESCRSGAEEAPARVPWAVAPGECRVSLVRVASGEESAALCVRVSVEWCEDHNKAVEVRS